jgi:hypothetical protein
VIDVLDGHLDDVGLLVEIPRRGEGRADLEVAERGRRRHAPAVVADLELGRSLLELHEVMAAGVAERRRQRDVAAVDVPRADAEQEDPAALRRWLERDLGHRLGLDDLLTGIEVDDLDLGGRRQIADRTPLRILVVAAATASEQHRAEQCDGQRTDQASSRSPTRRRLRHHERALYRQKMSDSTFG